MGLRSSHDAGSRRASYRQGMTKARGYAVVWTAAGSTGSGRLEAWADRFDLYGRGEQFSVAFTELASAAIARRHVDRLRGLPALVLRRRDGGTVRIASLEGAGVLHELTAHVQGAGLTVVDGRDRDVGDDGSAGAGLRLDGERAAEQREPLAHADEPERVDSDVAR